MFFVVRSNDSFNFPLGLIEYIIIVIVTYPAELVVVVVVCAGWFLAQPSWWCRVRCQILGYQAQLLVAAARACVCVCVCMRVCVTMYF